MEDSSMMTDQHPQEILLHAQGLSGERLSFFKSDARELLEKLLQKRVIRLLVSKHPNEIKRTNNPKYYKYHKIIGHPIAKCDTFRGQVP